MRRGRGTLPEAPRELNLLPDAPRELNLLPDAPRELNLLPDAPREGCDHDPARRERLPSFQMTMRMVWPPGSMIRELAVGLLLKR
jgi:hypothetical protein